MGPNPNKIFPNPKIPSLCFIKNMEALCNGDLIKIKNIID